MPDGSFLYPDFPNFQVYANLSGSIRQIFPLSRNFIQIMVFIGDKNYFLNPNFFDKMFLR